MTENTNTTPPPADAEAPEPAVGGSDLRLVRLLHYGWTPFADEISAIMADAATQIEFLMSQRKEWKCTVGNEDFITDEEDIAQEWRDDGLDVVSYFVPNV